MRVLVLNHPPTPPPSTPALHPLSERGEAGKSGGGLQLGVVLASSLSSVAAGGRSSRFNEYTFHKWDKSDLTRSDYIRSDFVILYHSLAHGWAPACFPELRKMFSLRLAFLIHL